MKITFELPNDKKVHQYCLHCHQEQISRIYQDGQTYYACANCQQISPRSLVIDPQVTWWVDPQTNDYWHESVGMFVRNQHNQILLFKRTIYPFAHTIPAGHLDTGEEAKSAAIREVEEEVGCTPIKVKLFSQEDVVGDECRRGADNHRWSLFTGLLPNDATITLNDEGLAPVWLSIEDALQQDLTFAARFFLQKYGSEIIRE